MSSRQQDSTSKQAGKLPLFPARKVSSAKVGQSPSTRQRFESLPGVQHNGRTPERPDQTQRGRNGAQTLSQLKKHHDATGNCHGPVHGFESPQAARARQQVARDEVLSYMQQRRHHHQQHGDIHAEEPRDTSSHDAPMDCNDEPSLSAIAKKSYDSDSLGSSSISLLPKTSMLRAATPTRHPAVHRLMDDDVQASSADQSPTRHVHSRQSLPGLAQGTRCNQNSLGGDAKNGGERGNCLVSSVLGVAAAAPSNANGRVAGGRRGSALTPRENAFAFSKKDEAVRVIQTYWRRWQNWKAKLRREAEERILQQLLGDESGLNLRMLLSGGGSAETLPPVKTSGQQQGPRTRPCVNAASATSGGGAAAVDSGADGPTAKGHNATRRLFEHREVPSPEPSIAAAVGRGGGAVGADASDVGRFAKQRPFSAVEAALANRGRSPARPSTVGPSPSRDVQGLVRPVAHTTGGAAYSPQALRSGRGILSQSGDDESVQLRVHPNKKHSGGHAVYTFVATPTKHPPSTVVSGASTPTKVAITAHESNGHPAFRDTVVQHRAVSGFVATQPTELPQDRPPVVCFTDVQGSRASADSDVRDRPSSNGSTDKGAGLPGPSFSQSTLPHHMQPSLDADANPAMASPALSGANSFGDPTAFGAPHPTWPAFPQKTSEADSMPSQHHSLGNSTLDICPCTSPTMSLEIQKEALQEPQHVPSPSPQRKARNEALQRLKLQGSQRGSASGHAVVVRPLFPPARETEGMDAAAAARPTRAAAAPPPAAPPAAAAPLLQRWVGGAVTEGGQDLSSGGHMTDNADSIGDGIPGRHHRSGSSQPQKRQNHPRAHTQVQGRGAPQEGPGAGRVVPGYEVQGTCDVSERDKHPGRHGGHHRRREDGSGQTDDGSSDHSACSQAAPASHVARRGHRHQHVVRQSLEERAPERSEHGRLGRAESLAATHERGDERHERKRQNGIPDGHSHGHGAPLLQQQPQHNALNKAGKREEGTHHGSEVPREGRQELGGMERHRHRHTHSEHGHSHHADPSVANGGHGGGGGYRHTSADANLQSGSQAVTDTAGHPATGSNHHTMQRAELGARREQLQNTTPGEGCTRVALDRGAGHRTGTGHRHRDDGSAVVNTSDQPSRTLQQSTGKQEHQQLRHVKDRPSATQAWHNRDADDAGIHHQSSQMSDGPHAQGYEKRRAINELGVRELVTAVASRQPHTAVHTDTASEDTSGELTFRRAGPEGGGGGGGGAAAAVHTDRSLLPVGTRRDDSTGGGVPNTATCPTLPGDRSGYKDAKRTGKQVDVGVPQHPGVGTGRAVGSGGGASGGQDRAAPLAVQPAPEVDVSITAERMTSILKYLDEVELQAEQEATCAAVAPALHITEPLAAAAIAAALLPGGGSGHASRLGSGHTRPYVGASAVSTGSRRGHNALPSRPGTAHTGVSQAAQRSQAFAVGAALTGGRHQRRSRSRSRLRRRSEASPGRPLADASEDYYDNETDGHSADADDEDGCPSVAALSMVSGVASRPAFLAESVYENVRTKIRRLQDDVKQRDARISDLMQEVESLQAAQRTCLLDADARLSEMLAAQRAEYEAAVSRHLAFVDRLLADKEALASRANQLAEQLKSAEERQEKAIAKLKDGWAAELKRQKEIWAATEKQRREAWMQSKAAEIKDVTVKGLEGEVEKLLSRHRAELSAAQQAAADEARRHLDTYVAQNEVAVRQLKERMARETEETVEKERAAATMRLRAVSERYEQQLQTQRMRLVADADLKLEQLEQARKEERKRYDEAVAAAREAGDTRQREAEEDWKREKEALRKAHDKQIEALREQYETGQEGWRAAMAERARKEVSERVAAIREKLLQERNEEVQAVMTRLEAEHAKAVEDLKAEFRRMEEAAAARAAAELKEAKRAHAKMAERFRTVGVASQAAEERLAVSELANEELRRELESRNSTIKWLEAQVTAAKDEAAARERDVRSLGAEKAAVAAEAAAAVGRDKQQVEARLAQAIQENQDLRTRHASEMAAVEARVRTTLAKKDDVIAGLRDQLTNLAEELRSTQEVLRQQQEELGSEVDDGGSTGRQVYSEGRGCRSGRY